jgi:hypothetical protein
MGLAGAYHMVSDGGRQPVLRLIAPSIEHKKRPGADAPGQSHCGYDKFITAM